MRSRTWLPLLAFMSALGVHAVYSARKTEAGECVTCELDDQGQCLENPAVPTSHTILSRAAFETYVKEQDYFLGLAYALALSFAVYALTDWRRNRRRAAAGAVAGLSLSSLLLAAGCFLVGCCGSPMLAVWMGLFGAKAFGLAKPLVAAATALSVLVGYLWLRRRSTACGCDTPTV